MKKLICAAISLVFVFCLSVTAFAQVSPTAKVIHKIDIGSGIGGTADYVADDDDDDTYIVIAKPDDGYVFVGWKIDGDYEIVEGDENSETIKIKVKGDSKVEPIYEKIEATTKPGDTTATKVTGPTAIILTTTPIVTGKPDDSDTAPQTGDNSVLYLVLLVAAAASIAIVTRKVLVK